MPLAENENERARELTSLDERFLLPDDRSKMPPEAASYFGRRPWLTAEVCKQFRIGYLPSDGGSMMRGGIVYPYFSESGELLTWFKRDPRCEEKHRKWSAGNRDGREPEKCMFVKGFRRRIELCGQHQLSSFEEFSEKLSGIGLPVVEGPNDVMRLSCFGIPAAGLCSCQITREQAKKVGELARRYAFGTVLLLGDLDEKGEHGVKTAFVYLSSVAAVRLGWSPKMFGGRFRGRQAEQLSLEEWEEIASHARTGEAVGWKFE